MSLLGIDIGTTGCKAAAFSEAGCCLAAGYREYPALHPEDGWAELDSRQVFDSIRTVIGQVATAARADPISALSVSSMGEAVVPVTRDRRILGPSILASDSRGMQYVEQLRQRFSAEEFYRINPNILLGPNYTLPKIRWLKDHQPDIYRQTGRFLLWGDFLCFMLGGDPVANYSLANRTLLFDIRAQDWSDVLFDFCGMEREKFGACVPCGTRLGTVSRVAAREFGLPEKTVVVAGGHDQCCNALGAGIYRAGRAVCGIGTYECITPVFNHIPGAALMLAHGLNVEHHVVPGLYVSFLYNQSGSLVRWFRDTFAADERTAVDIYDRLAREMPVEPTRLLTLPHFEITGPAHFLTNSSGVIAGLRTSTSRGEILKSIMESATLYFVEGIQALAELGIGTSEFIATGGGSKSDAWLQIKADIFGVPLLRPRFTEAGVLGAAILAGVATGVFTGYEEGVRRFVRTDRVFEPDMDRHCLYREKIDLYRRLYPALKDLLARL